MNALSQVSSELVLRPACGRSYATAAAMVDAWNEGKDFKLTNGQYCSIRDIKKLRNDSSRITLTQNFFEYTVV